MSPVLFISPAILARAGLYTFGLMASIAFVGATAKNDMYLCLGGPVLSGAAIVVLSGIAPHMLPAAATSALTLSHAVLLYGGLVVTSGFVFCETQRILDNERGWNYDPVASAVLFELDFLNLFIRIVELLCMRGSTQSK
jgi:FtsH-binding integral membrane protein